MTNLDEARAATRAIIEHAQIVETFLSDPSIEARALELEVFGRANLIDAKLARLRGEFVGRLSGRPDNVHTIGDRGEVPAA